MAEAWAYRDSDHLPSLEEGQCSVGDGVEVGADLDDPSRGPDLEVVRSVVEGFVLVEGGCHPVSRVVAKDHAGKQLHRRNQVEVVDGAEKHFAHVGPPLVAYPVLAQSSAVAFGGQPTACEAFSKEPALISEALEQG